MENTEKIINKIKKVLELSKNNPSEKEAQAAALKAQKLMAEYHISMTEVNGIEDSENITEECISVGIGNKWKYRLSAIIARNFRCQHFYYGNSDVVFYGYKTDAEIAAETFKYLFSMGNKLANNFYNKKRNECRKIGCHFYGKGIKNCFLIGFTDGIAEILEKQCTALMIVTPKEVQETFEEKTKHSKPIKGNLDTKSYYAKESWEEGKRNGKDAINNRQLAMA